MSHSAALTKVFFGDDTTAVDLSDVITGAITITSAGDLVTERLKAQPVRTADAATVGYTVAMTCYASDKATEALGVDNAKGELVVTTANGSKAWAIPASLSAESFDHPATGSSLVTLTFTQRPGFPAGFGDVKETGSQPKKDDGSNVQIQPGTSITRPEAAVTATKTNPVVVVNFITAEGIK